jgi:hypothetical protein
MFVCNISVKKSVYVTRIKVLNAKKSPFFWVVTLYSLEKKLKHFGGTCHLHF